MDRERNRYPFGSSWFVVWTKSRQEKVVASLLESFGIPNFLPLKSEVRQWTDRKQTVQVPLFSGYLFVRINPLKDSRLQVLKTRGVVGLVGNHEGPLPVPDQQIEQIRTVLAQRVECTVFPLLEEGDRVRVVRGVLTGVEGTLLRTKSEARLVISIDLIHQSVAVQVSREDVEPISRHAA